MQEGLGGRVSATAVTFRTILTILTSVRGWNVAKKYSSCLGVVTETAFKVTKDFIFLSTSEWEGLLIC